MAKFDLKQHEEQKRQDAQKRLNELHARDWSAVPNSNIYDGLSAAEQKSLHIGCPSFQEAESTYDTIVGFRGLTAEEQSTFFSDANEKTRGLLEADGYVSSQTKTFAVSPAEHEAESSARREEQQNRIFTESADAVESVARDDKYGLYPGVEFVNGKYRLTVDAGDGNSPEIFIGDSQKECFVKLTESKKHATRALRKRASQVQITKELRENLDIDVIEYPPLEVKVTLSPAEIFDATERMKDPTTAVAAAKLLAAAGRTQAEVDLANENTIRGRYLEQKESAERWLTENQDKFYPCPENIKALMDITATLNWAITKKNLDIAFAELVRQNALVEKLPEAEPQFRTGPAPKVRPAPFIPQSANPPASRVPAAPTVRPATRKILNNTSAAGGDTSFVRREAKPAKATPMTASEYAGISAPDLKKRYGQDPVFKARVDAYWNEGGR